MNIDEYIDKRVDILKKDVRTFNRLSTGLVIFGLVLIVLAFVWPELIANNDVKQYVSLSQTGLGLISLVIPAVLQGKNSSLKEKLLDVEYTLSKIRGNVDREDELLQQLLKKL